MRKLKKRLKYNNKRIVYDEYCCSKEGYLFHNYTEFQEFNDTDDEFSLDISELKKIRPKFIL